METLKTNILNAHGEYGQKWLEALPTTIKTLTQQWKLSDLTPVSNMTWNYVAKTHSKKHGDTALKIGCQPEFVADEIKAFRHFLNYGTVSLYEYDESLHALLLQQAQPGDSLSKTLRTDPQSAINIFSNVVKKLISANQANQNTFQHVKHWLRALDDAHATDFPAGILEKGIRYKSELLGVSCDEFILHGDLHLDNILKDGENWVIIDPKGIVGCVEFEVAKFDFVTDEELNSYTNEISKLFNTRSKLLAESLNLNLKHLQMWTYVRLVNAICWAIQDRVSADVWLKKIELFFSFDSKT